MLADPTLTRYGLSKEFTRLRRTTSHLQCVGRAYQNTAIHQARTAADISNKRGNGELGFRSRKRDQTMAVVCDMRPRFVDNMHASLPGIGVVRLRDEQSYRYPHNWLHGARSFRLVDVTPKSWAHAKPGDRIYRLYVTYDLPRPERAHTGVVAGIDRGITNPTTVCKTDGETVAFTCYDTAASFRTNQSWNDGARRTISHRNRHSRSTGKMRRQRKRYNWYNANAREYAEWLLAKEVCHGVDIICIEDLHIETMTRYGNSSKRGLNRGLRYIRHHSILRKVWVVAERLGIRIIKVESARHKSGMLCVRAHGQGETGTSMCFLCLACGRIDNADSNASANIVQRGTDIMVPAGGGIALERREMGRTRKPPRLARTDPDAMRRRERQARNRPKTSSAMKHLGKYAYITRCYSGI